jgi:two-component system LytT family response regulator
MTLRVLVVDDEPIARRRIKRLLTGEPGVAIVGESADGESALGAIAASSPDLVLLDVQMPGLDGFDVLRAIPAGRMPAIVFVTAFDHYAIQAFEVHAVDYLLKPFTSERLHAAIACARERIASRSGAAAAGALAEALGRGPRYLTRVAVRTSSRTTIVDLGDVDWIAADDNYVRLHAAGRAHLVRGTLKALEPQLDPERFVRIHRSAIVQIDRIVEIRPATHGDCDLVLRDGTHLTLTRTCRDRAQRKLHRR